MERCTSLRGNINLEVGRNWETCYHTFALFSLSHIYPFNTTNHAYVEIIFFPCFNLTELKFELFCRQQWVSKRMTQLAFYTTHAFRIQDTTVYCVFGKCRETTVKHA